MARLLVANAEVECGVWCRVERLALCQLGTSGSEVVSGQQSTAFLEERRGANRVGLFLRTNGAGKEDACLKEGMSFAEVVRVYSDESGAATREGTIGTVERSDVAADFADAAFELNAGEVSQVVETNFGFHVILRVE